MIKMQFSYIAIFLVILSLESATAGILFEDNFNSSPEWAPTSTIASFGATGYSGGATTSPFKWTWWSNVEAWNPYYLLSPTPGSQPTVQISGSASYGLSSENKAFVVHNESRAAGDGWGADGMFEKLLPQEEPELYMQVKLKFSPAFKWADPGTQSDSIKMFRIERYHNNSKAPRWLGAGNTLNFDDGNNAPNFIINATYKTVYDTGFTMYISNRCTPNAYDYILKNNIIYRCIKTHVSDITNAPPNSTYWTVISGDSTGLPIWSEGQSYYTSNYQCSQADPTYARYNYKIPVFDSNGNINNIFANTLGDGEWHTVKLHVRINSAPGVSDGISEIWIDGHLSDSKRDRMWVGVHSDNNIIGWNKLSIGGNALNYFAGSSNTDPFTTGKEQWYAVDDVVVSTTDIPYDYFINNSKASAESAPIIKTITSP